MTKAVIDSFGGEHDWLSNFAAAPVTLDGITFPTVEHAYQAAKTVLPDEREHFLLIAKAGNAKKLGKHVTMRPDWEQVKVAVMLDLVRQKFQNPVMAAKLRATGDAELIEGNWWGDTFWGVCKGVGQNQLGKILMQVREEL